jgi:hypothetical protein
MDIRAAIVFGLFFGAAAATKITYMLFPAVAFGYAILRTRYGWREFLARVAVVAVAASATWFCIVFLDYRLIRFLFLSYLPVFIEYLMNGGGLPPLHDLSPLAWLVARSSTPGRWNAAIYLAPLLALLGLACCRNRDQLALGASLFIASLCWTVFLYNRDYPTTLLEAAFGLHLFLYSATAKIVWPNLSSRWDVPARPVSYTLAAIFVVVILKGKATVASILGSAHRNTIEQGTLAAAQNGIPGKHLWVIPDNSLRPLSIESAIMKGGLEPGSRIMGAMFPNLEFRFQWPRVPFQLTDYSAVFFPFNGPIDGQIDLISREYSVPLNQWKCRLAAKIESQMIGVCEPRN